MIPDVAGTALYVEAIRQGVRNVWRVRVDPATLEWVAAERLTTGSGPDAAIALSSSGTRMAFTTEQRLSRLWTFPLNAAGRFTGKGTPFTPEDGRADNAALSPDGRFVTYHLIRTGRARDELLLTGLDSNKTELFAVDAWAVAWSPDSRRLAYAHRRLPDLPPPREWELVVRELGGPERVIRPRSAKSVLMPSDWTRDGFILGSLVSPLARARAPAKLALWPASPSAAQVEQLVLEDAQGGLWQARLSPNGHWLAFVQGNERAAPPLRVALYVARPHSPPAEWTRIAPHHPWADKPRWSPDGRMLYFISNEGSSFFNLWAIKFDSAQGIPIGEPFRLTAFNSPDLVMPPDVVGAEIGISARRAILTLEAVRGSIWLLENVDR
jgi:Tol biopolymer transport system component